LVARDSDPDHHPACAVLALSHAALADRAGTKATNDTSAGISAFLRTISFSCLFALKARAPFPRNLRLSFVTELPQVSKFTDIPHGPMCLEEDR